MSKVKMRCITCGKWFQSANAKEVTCPECTQKARKEKLAAKSGQATPNKATGQAAAGTGTPARTVPPAPKPASSGTSRWFDSISDIKVSEPEQPPTRPKLPSSPVPRDNRGGPGSPSGPGGYRDRDERGPGSPTGYREGANRDRGPGGPGGYRDRGPGIAGTLSGGQVTIGQRPRQPMEGGPGRGPRPGGIGEQRPDRPPYAGGQKGGKPAGKPAKARVPKPATPPKPKREKIPPPAPFTPTEEQIKQVEERYLELATPAEYDGIRTQIGTELSIPKKAVKKIVKELRDRQGIPSWWELQTYKGDAEELEKIRTAYEPHLPLPPIGVHKTIADELSIKPGDVYQAIKLIRQEMHLPQYNDPALHGIELRSTKKKDAASQESTTQEEQGSESKEEHAEVPASATDAETPSDAVIESPASETDTETSPAQAVEAAEATETPEAVTVTGVDGKTSLDE